MRIYRTASVLDEAKARIGWLFDEFENVVVAVSGGKDSTVLLHLALEVAAVKRRLPVPILWIDQEAEWEATVDIVREWMYRDDVKPYWLQMPMRLFNATSASDHWLQCWDPVREADWMHPRDPIAITENRYGTDRFHKLFPAIMRVEFHGPVAFLGGVRAEESPRRAVGLTWAATYKHVTWGKILDRPRGQYSFYPLYDWSYSDVWKAIHAHGWAYNRIYDAQYRYGLPVHEMRVSNVHHETAVRHLWYMQEVEPQTFDRLTLRLAGIDAASKFGPLDYFPDKLPRAFFSWREYRDYLLDKLIEPDWQPKFRTWFAAHDRAFGDVRGDGLFMSHVRAILLNDYEGVTMNAFLAGGAAVKARAKHAAELAEAAI